MFAIDLVFCGTASILAPTGPTEKTNKTTFKFNEVALEQYRFALVHLLKH